MYRIQISLFKYTLVPNLASVIVLLRILPITTMHKCESWPFDFIIHYDLLLFLRFLEKIYLRYMRLLAIMLCVFKLFVRSVGHCELKYQSKVVLYILKAIFALLE